MTEKGNLRTLINSACGKRSMRDFAADCNMSPAWLYRLAAGGIRKMPPEDTLLAIVNNAVPESDVSLSALKKACQEAVADSHLASPSSRDRGLRLERYAQQRIQNTLLSRNAAIQSCEERGYRMRWDFGYYVSKGAHEEMWLFETKVMRMSRPAGIRELYYQIGLWACYPTETRMPVWYHLVYLIDDDDITHSFISQLKDIEPLMNISLIFINMKTNRLSEHVLTKRVDKMLSLDESR